MRADRFFSVHYDMRHNPKIDLLRDMGGGLVAYGRWLVLMAILYDCGGLYDFTSNAKARYLVKELDFDSSEDLKSFLETCAECELISADSLAMNHIVCGGICEQLEYQRKKSEAGKKGMESRWSKKKQANSTC